MKYKNLIGIILIFSLLALLFPTTILADEETNNNTSSQTGAISDPAGLALKKEKTDQLLAYYKEQAAKKKADLEPQKQAIFEKIVKITREYGIAPEGGNSLDSLEVYLFGSDTEPYGNGNVQDNFHSDVEFLGGSSFFGWTAINFEGYSQSEWTGTYPDWDSDDIYIETRFLVTGTVFSDQPIWGWHNPDGDQGTWADFDNAIIYQEHIEDTWILYHDIPYLTVTWNCLGWDMSAQEQERSTHIIAGGNPVETLCYDIEYA